MFSQQGASCTSIVHVGSTGDYRVALLYPHMPPAASVSPAFEPAHPSKGFPPLCMHGPRTRDPPAGLVSMGRSIFDLRHASRAVIEVNLQAGSRASEQEPGRCSFSFFPGPIAIL
jgi:hypothetical protein